MMFKRFFEPIADERLRLDDYGGAIRTATFESLRDFMTAHEYGAETFTIERNDQPES
jgi:hypothetical protein